MFRVLLLFYGLFYLAFQENLPEAHIEHSQISVIEHISEHMQNIFLSHLSECFIFCGNLGQQFRKQCVISSGQPRKAPKRPKVLEGYMDQHFVSATLEMYLKTNNDKQNFYTLLSSWDCVQVGYTWPDYCISEMVRFCKDGIYWGRLFEN